MKFHVQVSQHYDASVSRASDKGSAFFSLGYKKNEGILKYTNFENIAARINTSFNISPVLTVGENFTLTYTCLLYTSDAADD